jgi:hypothetical protein
MKPRYSENYYATHREELNEKARVRREARIKKERVRHEARIKEEPEHHEERIKEASTSREESPVPASELVEQIADPDMKEQIADPDTTRVCKALLLMLEREEETARRTGIRYDPRTGDHIIDLARVRARAEEVKREVRREQERRRRTYGRYRSEWR